MTLRVSWKYRRPNPNLTEEIMETYYEVYNEYMGVKLFVGGNFVKAPKLQYVGGSIVHIDDVQGFKFDFGDLDEWARGPLNVSENAEVNEPDMTQIPCEDEERSEDAFYEAPGIVYGRSGAVFVRGHGSSPVRGRGSRGRGTRGRGTRGRGRRGRGRTPTQQVAFEEDQMEDDGVITQEEVRLQENVEETEPIMQNEQVVKHLRKK